MRSNVLVLGLAFCMMASNFAFAGTCPAGSADCFLCGGVDGIPCTTNCTGAYREGVGNVACECPQGQECRCYCPYKQQLSADERSRCEVDPACMSDYLPQMQGAIGYTTKTAGSVMILRFGAASATAVEEYTVIYEGDTLEIPEGGSVFVVFPGNNIRGFFGEGEVTVAREGPDKPLALDSAGDFIALLSAIRDEVRDNAGCKGAVTVTGAGRLPQEDAQVAAGREHRMDYCMESEVIIEKNGGSQTVKVIEGRVAATNDEGKSVTLRTGEQFTSSADDFNAAGVKPFDYSGLDLGFADGYGSIECIGNCPAGKMQTPFPGCSCIEERAGGGCGSAFILPLILCAVLALRRN
ncbi:hypothetical protein L0Y65_05080 [Candidatus Micrarchaeota archaeon]|nr:hypothetical protein [Candidatus Micrarchaeota archaeon]